MVFNRASPSARAPSFASSSGEGEGEAGGASSAVTGGGWSGSFLSDPRKRALLLLFLSCVSFTMCTLLAALLPCSILASFYFTHLGRVTQYKCGFASISIVLANLFVIFAHQRGALKGLLSMVQSFLCPSLISPNVISWSTTCFLSTVNSLHEKV